MKSKNKRWSNAFDCVETTDILNVELSDEAKRAYIKIPLMHVGPNAKGLYWTENVLKKIAPMFEHVTFKYDLEGKEGSSHVPEKLYSPFYDVGWTSKSYYEPTTRALWVEGWVTHPEPVSKLGRMTPDGCRELNYASMGVLIDPDDVICTICGQKMAECGHKRNEVYGGKVAYAMPRNAEKALHVALTNAPADTEADIAEAVFQELRNFRGENMADGPAGVGATDSYTNQQSRPNILDRKQPQQQTGMAIAQFQKDQAGETMRTANPTDNQFAKTNDAVGAMAEGEEPMGGTMGGEAEPGSEMELVDLMKTVIQRLIAVEEKVASLGGGAAPAGGAPAPAPGPAPAMAEPDPGMGKGGAAAMAEPDPGKQREMADRAVYNKYHKRLLREVADKAIRTGRFNDAKNAVAYFADKSIDQLEVLDETLAGIAQPVRAVVETANVSEFGAPMINRPKGITEMTASERKQRLGEFASWDACFRPEKYEVY